MDSNVIGMEEGQMIEGWITVTPMEGQEPVIYGIFEDKESAENWAKHCLQGTIVRPIFTPTFNRG